METSEEHSFIHGAESFMTRCRVSVVKFQCDRVCQGMSGLTALKTYAILRRVKRVPHSVLRYRRAEVIKFGLESGA